MNLHLLNETFTNGFTYNVINMMTMLSIFSGMFVIMSKNPIVSMLFLISLFLNIACYLMMLGLNFMGLSYLLVYMGAVSMLFLFMLMLINVSISELSNDNYNSMPLAMTIGTFFSFNLSKLINNDLLNKDSLMGMNSYNAKSDMFYVTSLGWDNSLAEVSHITSIGNVMYTAYPMWLMITSLVLLLAMVGTMVMTIKK